VGDPYLRESGAAVINNNAAVAAWNVYQTSSQLMLNPDQSFHESLHDNFTTLTMQIPLACCEHRRSSRRWDRHCCSRRSPKLCACQLISADLCFTNISENLYAIAKNSVRFFAQIAMYLVGTACCLVFV
jgi:hypothetical protein